MKMFIPLILAAMLASVFANPILDDKLEMLKVMKPELLDKYSVMPTYYYDLYNKYYTGAYSTLPVVYPSEKLVYPGIVDPWFKK